jgi:hypothetical protein
MALAVSAVGCGGAEQAPTPTVVAQTDLSGLFSARLIVDHGELFWNDSTRVYRVNTDGGTPSVVHENGCGPLYGFAVDADNVYVGTCGSADAGGAPTLVAVGRQNGQETVLETGDYALDVAKTPDGFAYVSCGALTLLGATGGPGEAISTGSCAYDVTAVGDHLVVTVEGPAAVVVDPSTKQVVPLGALNVLGADTQHAFVARDNGSNGTEILALDLHDASLARVIDRQPALCGSAASDGRNLYFAVTGSDAGNDCTLLKVPVAGGSAQVLVENRPTVANIGTDGEFIYWLERSANRVMKLRM